MQSEEDNQMAEWKLNQMAKSYDMDGFGGKMDRKRELTPYNKFFAKHRKAGLSPADIGELWRKQKSKSGSKTMKKNKPSAKLRKANPWIECEKKLGKRKNKLTKKEQSAVWRRTKPKCDVSEYNKSVRAMKKKIGSKTKKVNPWIECEKKLGKRKNKLTKKEQSAVWRRTKPKCDVSEYNKSVRAMKKRLSVPKKKRPLIEID